MYYYYHIWFKYDFLFIFLTISIQLISAKDTSIIVGFFPYVEKCSNLISNRLSVSIVFTTLILCPAVMILIQLLLTEN